MPHVFTSILFGIGVLLLSSGSQAVGAPPPSGNQVADSAAAICPVLVGEPVPDVRVTTATGASVDLHAIVTQQPTLLIFYRGGWCPFCTMHLAELQTIQDDLQALGYQIVAISMDRPGKLRDAMTKHERAYTLLSDSAAVATTAFGLAYHATNANTERLETASGQAHHILPVPAAFLVDTEGIITFAYVNPNYRVRIKSALLLAAAKAAHQ